MQRFCSIHVFGLLALLPMLAHAQMPDANNLQELEQAGYVRMTRISTPLLYPASTGKPFNLKTLLIAGRADMPQEAQQPLVDASYSRDEFKVHALVESFRPMVDEQVAAIKRTGGYLVPLRFTLGEYDFERHRFPLKLALSTKKAKAQDALHCSGAYDKFQNTPLTACISVSNWTENNPAFQYLAIDDANEAKQVKQLLANGKAGFYFVTVRDGAFRLATGAPLRVGGFFEQALVSGTQPARVIGLVLANLGTGDILIAGAMPGAAPRISSSRDKQATDPVTSAGASHRAENSPPPAMTNTAPAPALDQASHTAADGVRDPVSKAGAPEPWPAPVVFGVPKDPSTLHLDKLLAVLSYTVYSDSGKLASAEQAVDELRSTYERIQVDAQRDPLIKARELKDLKPRLDAAELKNSELKAQLALKERTVRTYGLVPLEDAELSRLGAAGQLYFERYGMDDGRQIVVFRGTDNGHDIWTDLQIGLTPELANELLKRTKSGRSMSTGLDQASEDSKGKMPGAFTGRPPAFAVATNLIRKIALGGIKAEQLILTGHSLGGGYAQYAGLHNRAGQIVAFNPAPLSEQLQKDVASARSDFPTSIRHYVSYISSRQSKSGAYGDPVSQFTKEYLGQPEMTSLRVLGHQYAVPVCADLRGPEYRSFSLLFLDGIKHATLSSIDRGYHMTKTVGATVGQLKGAATASTEHESAMKSGADVGKLPGKAAGTATYCLKHPYMCTGKLAVGGAASAATRTELAPRAWTILSAHKMKNLEESILKDGEAQCEDPALQLGPVT